MLAKRIVALASLALTLATPVRRVQRGSSCAASNGPTLPINGGDDELPQPEEGEVLKYILLGHGIQNYTCTPGEEAAASGAVAVLYDATSYFPLQGRRSVATESHFNALTTLALWANDLPLNGDDRTQFGAATDYPFPAAHRLDLPGISMPFVGHHFFDADGVPVFHSGVSESDSASDFVFRARLADKVPAPTRSDSGPLGTGAVAWLHLDDNGESRGVSRVYRVATAGGSPRECVDDQPQSVPYATYYWVFGPEN